jgi:RNA polymerase sigma-70 factor (ECF subfamily)
LAAEQPAGLETGVQRYTQSDEALVARMALGHEPAFDELYERYYKRVFLFVDKRLRNRADTEETVQEVFINVFNSIDGFRGEAPFAAWLFGVTRRTLSSRFKRKRHPTVPLFEEDQDSAVHSVSSGTPHPSPLEAYECEELLTQIEGKLATRLSDEQRQLFRLHHLEDRPISEIALALDKTENAVKSNLYRARKVLLAR